MNDAPERNEGLYAIRLLPPLPGGASPRIAGRIEQVLSGRCHDFEDGAALLACLALEQQRLEAAGR
jgi:hypothetical protein